MECSSHTNGTICFNSTKSPEEDEAVRGRGRRFLRWSSPGAEMAFINMGLAVRVGKSNATVKMDNLTRYVLDDRWKTWTLLFFCCEHRGLKENLIIGQSFTRFLLMCSRYLLHSI